MFPHAQVSLDQVLVWHPDSHPAVGGLVNGGWGRGHVPSGNELPRPRGEGRPLPLYGVRNLGTFFSKALCFTPISDSD